MKKILFYSTIALALLAGSPARAENPECESALKIHRTLLTDAELEASLRDYSLAPNRPYRFERADDEHALELLRLGAVRDAEDPALVRVPNPYVLIVNYNKDILKKGARFQLALPFKREGLPVDETHSSVYFDDYLFLRPGIDERPAGYRYEPNDLQWGKYIWVSALARDRFPAPVQGRLAYHGWCHLTVLSAHPELIPEFESLYDRYAYAPWFVGKNKVEFAKYRDVYDDRIFMREEFFDLPDPTKAAEAAAILPRAFAEAAAPTVESEMRILEKFSSRALADEGLRFARELPAVIYHFGAASKDQVAQPHWGAAEFINARIDNILAHGEAAAYAADRTKGFSAPAEDTITGQLATVAELARRLQAGDARARVPLLERMARIEVCFRGWYASGMTLLDFERDPNAYYMSADSKTFGWLSSFASPYSTIHEFFLSDVARGVGAPDPELQ